MLHNGLFYFNCAERPFKLRSFALSGISQEYTLLIEETEHNESWRYGIPILKYEHNTHS